MNKIISASIALVVLFAFNSHADRISNDKIFDESYKNSFSKQQIKFSKSQIQKMSFKTADEKSDTKTYKVNVANKKLDHEIYISGNNEKITKNKSIKTQNQLTKNQIKSIIKNNFRANLKALDLIKEKNGQLVYSLEILNGLYGRSDLKIDAYTGKVISHTIYR